jgi:hypothetical protein
VRAGRIAASPRSGVVGSRAVAGTQRVARDGGAKLPRGQGVCGTPAEGGFTVLNDVVLNQVLVSFGARKRHAG